MSPAPRKPKKREEPEAAEPQAGAQPEQAEAEVAEVEATAQEAAGGEPAGEVPGEAAEEPVLEADAPDAEAPEADEAEAPDAEEPDAEEPTAEDDDDDEDEDEDDEEPVAAATPAARPRPAAPRRRSADGRVVVRAQAKYVRSSARKARLVADNVRGKSVQEARAILAHTPRSVARDWSKLLESAIANAENNHELVGDELKVHAITADEGPTLKRFRPRAMGRATRIRKRTSHLTIQLTPKETR
jgi:ribosomal protein L22